MADEKLILNLDDPIAQGGGNSLFQEKDPLKPQPDTNAWKWEDHRKEVIGGVIFTITAGISIGVGVYFGGQSKTPTQAPTSTPTETPTTDMPTDIPTHTPTIIHTPTWQPTKMPTHVPTTSSPTDTPTDIPTLPPTQTQTPTHSPTYTPTLAPIHGPTRTPTQNPTYAPTTQYPTTSPTEKTPTASPTPCVNPHSDLNYGLSVVSTPEEYEVTYKLKNSGADASKSNTVQITAEKPISPDKVKGLSINSTMYYNVTDGVMSFFTLNQTLEIPKNAEKSISYTWPQTNNPKDLSEGLLLPPHNFGTSFNGVEQTWLDENADKCAQRIIPEQVSFSVSTDSISDALDPYVNAVYPDGVVVQDSGAINADNISAFNQLVAAIQRWGQQSPLDTILPIKNYDVLGLLHDPLRLKTFLTSVVEPLKSLKASAISFIPTNPGEITPEYEEALVQLQAAVNKSLADSNPSVKKHLRTLPGRPFSYNASQELVNRSNTVNRIEYLTYNYGPNIADTPLTAINTPVPPESVTGIPNANMVKVLTNSMYGILARDPINPNDPLNNFASGIPFPGGTDKFPACAIDGTNCTFPHAPPLGSQRILNAGNTKDGSSSVLYNPLFNEVITGTYTVENMGNIIEKNNNVHIEDAYDSGPIIGSEGKPFVHVAGDIVSGKNNYLDTNAQIPRLGSNPHTIFNPSSNSSNRSNRSAGLIGAAVISFPVVVFSAVAFLSLALACYLFQQCRNYGKNETHVNDSENPKSDQELESINIHKFH